MIVKYIIEEKDFDMLAKMHDYCAKNKRCESCIFYDESANCCLAIAREKACREANISVSDYNKAILKRM